MNISAGPLVGHTAVRLTLSSGLCPLSLSTGHKSAVSGQYQCLVYCTPPLMVPRQARNTKIPSTFLGDQIIREAFRCTGAERERPWHRNIGKRKLRASEATKHWKT